MITTTLNLLLDGCCKDYHQIEIGVEHFPSIISEQVLHLQSLGGLNETVPASAPGVGATIGPPIIWGGALTIPISREHVRLYFYCWR